MRIRSGGGRGRLALSLGGMSRPPTPPLGASAPGVLRRSALMWRATAAAVVSTSRSERGKTKKAGRELTGVSEAGP